MQRTIFAILLLAGSTAHADETIDVSLCAGATIGTVRWNGPGGDGSANLRMSESLSAALVSLRGFYGGKLSDAVALGARVDVTAYVGEANFPHSYIDGGLEATGGPEVVVRPRASKLFGRASAGAGVTSFVMAVDAVYGRDNPPLAETLAGPVARALVGWSLSPHFDVALEARAAYFFADHTTYAPLAVLVGLHATDL